MSLVVSGIDLGTQSTKVILYDAVKKTVLALTQCKYEPIVGPGGLSEQEASTWTDAVKSCFQQIDPSLKSSIRAIGVSGQQHGFVPLDANGNVIYNVKLWCDTSTAPECDELTKKLGGSDWLLHNDLNLILPGFTAPKILWLKKHKPEVYAKLAHVLLPHDYLNFFLTGKYVMEPGDASGTALMNVRTRQWDPRVINAIDPALLAKLPPIVPSDSIVGGVTPATAAALGIPVGTPVSGGAGDNMAAAIGTGTVSDGFLTASLGTSGTLFGSSDKPVIDFGGALSAFCGSAGSWLPLLCTMNCTIATERTRELLDRSLPELDASAATAPIGSNGVICIPFFLGERTPNYPRGKGGFVGLTGHNVKKENFLRAAMEAGVFALRFGLDRFIELGFKPREIRAVGGGAKSAPWRKILADVCDVPVVVPGVTEAGAFGAALQALWAYKRQNGEKATIAQICDEHIALTGAPVKPVAANVKAYAAVYQEYLAYVTNFKPLFS